MTENAQLIASIYAAFGRGDIPFILQQVSDDIEMHGGDGPIIPWHGKHQGHAGAVQFFQQIAGSIRVTSFVPYEYVSEGEIVMTTGKWSGVVAATGKEFHTEWAMRFVVKNGKVTYHRSYEDTEMTASAFQA